MYVQDILGRLLKVSFEIPSEIYSCPYMERCVFYAEGNF